MTAEKRRERGTELCRRLAQDVAAFVPEGIGSWEPAWDIVAEPDIAYLEALTGWEAAPSDETKSAVREAYHAVVEAWREAAHQYEREIAGR